MLNIKNQNYNLKLKNDIKYRCYKFSLKIIKLISEFPNKQLFWVISDQLLRSATSIGANIVEAQSASSRKDFIHYFEIALKSANETKYWLCLLRDSSLIENGKISEILNESIEISKMIAASLLTLKGKRF